MVVKNLNVNGQEISINVNQFDDFREQKIIDSSEWVEVTLDNDDKIIKGIKYDGTIYINNIESPSISNIQNNIINNNQFKQDIISRFENRPLFTWTDDDYTISALNIVQRPICEELGFKCTYGIIPPLDTNGDVYFTEEQLENIKIDQELGHHFVMHPNHQVWYSSKNEDGTYKYDDEYVQKNFTQTIQLFNKHNLIHSTKLMIWPGSASVRPKVLEMAKDWCDFTTSGTYRQNCIQSSKSFDRWLGNRYFITLKGNTDTGVTKTEAKQIIDDCIKTNGWLIFGTHGAEFKNNTTTVDDVTPSVPNLKEIFKYAIDKGGTFKTLYDAWNERKTMFEILYGNSR